MNLSHTITSLDTSPLLFQPLRVEDWTALPKITLHEHIDGGLRPGTLLQLSRERGLPLPHTEATALGAWMHKSAETGNLVDYLRGFAYTVAAMASRQACAQVAYELAEDSKAEGCVLAEFRMAPQLLEEHGLSAQVALEGMLEGLAQSDLASGLIVCAMRTDSPERTLAAAKLAARYAGQGVVAFDLAGAELGYPASLHREAIDYAKAAGLGITLHAGEADHGGRVIEAGQWGATRIGHGIRIVEDVPERAARVAQAKALGLHFEVCPSSNVHTGAAPSLEAHPLKSMLQEGLSVSLASDNRLMSGTTLCQELHVVYTQIGLSLKQILDCQWQAIHASFCTEAQKEKAKTALERFAARYSLA